MAISTTDHDSTGTRSLVPFAFRNPRRVAIKVDADVTFFGAPTGGVGFPWTADDGEFAPDIMPDDFLYVEGIATLSIMEWGNY